MKSRIIFLSFVLFVVGFAAAGNAPVFTSWTHGGATLDDNGVLVDDIAPGVDQGFMLSRSGVIQAVFTVDPIETTLLAKALPNISPEFHIFTQYQAGEEGMIEIGAIRDNVSDGARIKIKSGATSYIHINHDANDVDTSIYGTDINKPVAIVDASENELNVTKLNVSESATFTGIIITPKEGNQTISGGTITAAGPWYKVEPESLAATDDLCTISGGVTGQELYLSTVNAARDVTVLDGGGCNIDLNGNRLLDHPKDILKLFFDGSVWIELSYSDNR